MRGLGSVIKFALVGAGLAAAVFFGGRLVVSIVGDDPVILGLTESAERGGCPGTPNCVSSYASTAEHAIDPIACDAPTDRAIAVFADAIDTLPDVERRTETSWVVYSRIFRFPDDVQIEISRRGIEVYSASRLGSGDMGANRDRVEQLRDVIAQDARCA